MMAAAVILGVASLVALALVVLYVVARIEGPEED
jgi:hypothetical protein